MFRGGLRHQGVRDQVEALKTGQGMNHDRGVDIGWRGVGCAHGGLDGHTHMFKLIFPWGQSMIMKIVSNVS